MTLDVSERFKRETAGHEMTVLHDDGLYRHLAFRHKGPNYSGYYWFDLITVPGTLILQGDGDSFVFSRTRDMFEFFRGPVGHINPHYWAEKLTSSRGGRGGVMKYDHELLAACVQEDIAEYYKGKTIPDGLMDEIRREILDELIGDESLDRTRVDEFTFYENPDDRWKVPRKVPDFRFAYTYEWKCQDYDWWYLWACHAIVWGISKYDAHCAKAVA